MKTRSRFDPPLLIWIGKTIRWRSRDLALFLWENTFAPLYGTTRGHSWFRVWDSGRLSAYEYPLDSAADIDEAVQDFRSSLEFDLETAGGKPIRISYTSYRERMSDKRPNP